MNKHTLVRQVWTRPSYFLAFGFGSGLMPKAPGTWGTVAALPLYILLSHYCTWPVYLIVTVLATLLGVRICDTVSRELGVHDFSGIVWDEIVGYLWTMFLVPVGWKWMLLGFILFRLFDIWKPQPIRYLDARIKGGLGIVVDDLVAALFAWLVLQGMVWSLVR